MADHLPKASATCASSLETGRRPAKDFSSRSPTSPSAHVSAQDRIDSNQHTLVKYLTSGQLPRNAMNSGDGQTATYRIVTINGGRGACRLIRKFLDSGHNVTSIVNAYDDGRSTAELRRAFGILGPSDVAKTAIAMADPRIERIGALISVLEFRFPVDIDDQTLHEQLQEFAVTCRPPFWFDTLSRYLERYDLPPQLMDCIQAFIKHEKANPRGPVQLKDMAFRNLVLVGAFLSSDRSWRKAISVFCDIVGARGRIVLASEDNRWLVGVREDRSVERNEAEISEKSGARLEHLYSLRVPHARLSDYWSAVRQHVGVLRSLPRQYLVGVLARTWLYRLLDSRPRATTAAIDELLRAEFIVYCPGTLYSSILPTLMCQGIPKAMARSRARKVLLLPLAKDRDMENLDDLDVVKTILKYLGARDPCEYAKYIDVVLADSGQWALNDVRPDFSEIERAGIVVMFGSIRDEETPTLHDPAAVEHEILEAHHLPRRSLNVERPERPSAKIRR